jgi:hypothetical protein
MFCRAMGNKINLAKQIMTAITLARSISSSIIPAAIKSSIYRLRFFLCIITIPKVQIPLMGKALSRQAFTNALKSSLARAFLVEKPSSELSKRLRRLNMAMLAQSRLERFTGTNIKL